MLRPFSLSLLNQHSQTAGNHEACLQKLKTKDLLKMTVSCVYLRGWWEAQLGVGIKRSLQNSVFWVHGLMESYSLIDIKEFLEEVWSYDGINQSRDPEKSEFRETNWDWKPVRHKDDEDARSGASTLRPRLLGYELQEMKNVTLILCNRQHQSLCSGVSLPAGMLEWFSDSTLKI